MTKKDKATNKATPQKEQGGWSGTSPKDQPKTKEPPKERQQEKDLIKEKLNSYKTKLDKAATLEEVIKIRDEYLREGFYERELSDGFWRMYVPKEKEYERLMESESASDLEAEL